jgi:hypothetical protein
MTITAPSSNVIQQELKGTMKSHAVIFAGCCRSLQLDEEELLHRYRVRQLSRKPVQHPSRHVIFEWHELTVST